MNAVNNISRERKSAARSEAATESSCETECGLN